MIAMLTLMPSCAAVDELAGGHLEAAVADDHPDLLVGHGEARADRGRQREAHRAEAAGGDELARVVVLVVLGLPHLVLADVGDDERLALGDAPEVVDDVRGEEAAVVRHAAGCRARRSRPCSASMRSSQPCARGLRDERQERRERVASRRRRARRRRVTFLLISAGSSSTWIFFALTRVGLEVAGDAVVEAHAERDEEVGLLDRLVDPRLAVHAHHAERERVRWRGSRRGRAASRRPGCRSSRRARRAARSPRPSRCRGRRG